MPTHLLGDGKCSWEQSGAYLGDMADAGLPIIRERLGKWPFEDCSFKRRQAARLPGPCALSEAVHRDWTRSKSSC